MMKTVTILLIAVLLTAQVSTKAAPQPRDLIDTALEVASAALKGISAAIDAGLNFAEKALESAANDSDKLQQEIVKAADVLIQKARDELNKELEKLKNGTSEAGIDILDCAEAANASIVASADKAINASSDCVVNLYAEVLLSTKAVIVDLENKNNEIKEYENEITACRNATDVLACVLEDIEKIIQSATDISEDVQKDIEQVTDSIGELTKAGDTCLKPNSDAFEKDIENIFTDFSSCVQNKTNSTTNS